MIVISSSLSLIEDDPELDPDLPLIGWHNVVTRDNISAGFSEGSEDPVTNLANPATNLVWFAGNPGSPSENYVTVETGYTGDIDYLAIAMHNFGSQGVALSVEGSGDLATWFTLVDESLLGNDDVVMFRWEPQSLAGVRLKITNGNDDTFAGVLYVGKLLVMQRGLDIGDDFTPITYARYPNIVNGVAESGRFLGRIMIGETRSTEARFRWMEPDWYRTYFDPFAKAARVQPFFFAWSPDDYPTEVGYCWLAQPIIPTIDPVTQRIHATLSMGGIAEPFDFVD